VKSGEFIHVKGQTTHLVKSFLECPSHALLLRYSSNYNHAGNCHTSITIHDLCYNNSLILTMSVNEKITNADIDYAMSVFKKTYGALLENKLEEAAGSYCDPWCRKISSVQVMDYALNTNASLMEENDLNNKCNGELELVFVVEGTFWGCQDEEFPGVFSTASLAEHDDGEETTTATAQVKNANGSSRRRRRRRLPWLQQQQLRGLNPETCTVCAADSVGTITTPTSDQLIQAMTPYVTVLPDICYVLSADLTKEKSDNHLVGDETSMNKTSIGI
jgi:hypothetical protein